MSYYDVFKPIIEAYKYKRKKYRRARIDPVTGEYISEISEEEEKEKKDKALFMEKYEVAKKRTEAIQKKTLSKLLDPPSNPVQKAMKRGQYPGTER